MPSPTSIALRSLNKRPSRAFLSPVTRPVTRFLSRAEFKSAPLFADRPAPIFATVIDRLEAPLTRFRD